MTNWLKKVFLIDSLKTSSANHLIWFFGPAGYLSSYFIVNKLMIILKIITVNIALSAIIIIYFCWHIHALRKCALTKQKLLKSQGEVENATPRSLTKTFLRKLFLQESLTKSDPILITILIDLYFIVNTVDCLLATINHL